MLPLGSQQWAGQAGKSGSSSGALRGEPGPRPCLSACNKRPHFSAVLCPCLFHSPAPPLPGHLLLLCRAHCAAALCCGSCGTWGQGCARGAAASPWGFCCPVGLLLSCGVPLPRGAAGSPGWGCGSSTQHAARGTQRQGAPRVLFAKAQLWSAGEGTPLRAPRTNMYNAEAERGISFVRNHALTISCIHTVSAEFTSKSHAQEICSEAVWPVGLCIM